MVHTELKMNKEPWCFLLICERCKTELPVFYFRDDTLFCCRPPDPHKLYLSDEPLGFLSHCLKSIYLANSPSALGMPGFFYLIKYI